MYSNGIGTLVADLYIAWSYYYDAMNNYKQVEAIFRKGFDAGAQPLDDLSQAHQAFGVSMSRRMLYDDDVSKQQFAAKMEEKRTALTSLRAHRKKHVGSTRLGIAVRADNPGVVNQENVASSSNVRKLEIHEDAGAHALSINAPVARSIIDSARKKENVHEPGPWSKAKDGRSGKLFGKAGASSHLDFDIMEDDGFTPIAYTVKLFDKGIQLPEHFVKANNPQKSWDIPMFIAETPVARSIPCYDKFLCYPNKTTDISPEELRGFKWFTARDLKTSLTQRYEQIWSNTVETGARIPPGFVNGNVQQVENVDFKKFIEDENTSGFQTSLKRVYPSNGDEFSLEELLAKKFCRGEIKLLTEEDFVEIDDMDITDIGDRRQSIYVPSRQSFMPRKSIVPRKSVLPPPLIEEDEEFEVPELVSQASGAIRNSIVKRKLEDDDSKRSSIGHVSVKKECAVETPPRSVFNVFKPPQPVEKKQVVFNVDDDDETCSTQQFNLFIKQQSVSTPVSKKRPPVPALIEHQPLQPESPPEPEGQCTASEQMAADNMGMKLSTIMETTETTQSTKSSVTSGNDTDLHPKTPKHAQPERTLSVPQPGSAIRVPNPLMSSFRMPEDQTETCTKITIPIRAIPITTLKTPSTPVVPFEIFKDESVAIPSPTLEISVRSSSSETFSKVTQIEQPEQQPQIGNPEAQPQSEKLEMRPIVEISFAVPDISMMNIPPPMHPEESIMDIPATQDLATPPFEVHQEKVEIPATEEMTDDFDIPATQDAVSPDFDLPPTQDFEIPATEEFKIPMNEDFDIPATQDPTEEIEIPATEELTKKSSPVDKKNDSVPFCIYEDSIMEAPKAKTVAAPKIPDDEGTGFLHVSRKENLLVPPPNTVRSLSDEFLEMIASPAKQTETTKTPKENVSDLLKFSTASATGNSITTCLKGLKINETPSEASLTEEFKKSFSGSSFEPPKSATPTQNLFEDDLNTEKFSLALGNYKNSTLLIEAPMPKVDHRLSVPLEEDELMRMSGSSSSVGKPQMPEFKMPLPPAPLAKPAAASFKVFEDEFEDEDNDLSRSIYVPRPTPQLEIEEGYEDVDDLSSSFACLPSNRYEHTIIAEEHNLSIRVKEAIVAANGNPFEQSLRAIMLENCNFSQYLEQYIPTCVLLKKIPQLKPSLVVDVAEHSFKVTKFIAKGGFGSIFTARGSHDGKTYALKQEKPPNLWELYICVELKDRLKNKEMLPAFMNVEFSVVAMNASILITQFSPYGSIIQVCNKHKAATNKNVDEYVVMLLTTQLLSIMDHLHACKIIHGDIKPDNFLVMSK